MARKEEKTDERDFYGVSVIPLSKLHAKVIILIRVWERKIYLCIHKHNRNRENSYITSHKHRQTAVCTHITESFRRKSVMLQSAFSHAAVSYMLT